jgi:Tfp pilus assembly protein PilO
MVVILAVVVFGLVVGVVWQLISSNHMSNDIASGRQSLAALKSDNADCVKWANKYKTLSLELGERLPDCTWGDQEPYMVSQLSSVIESQGVRIDTLRPQPMVEQKGILRFPMRLELKTTLDDLARVLKDIQKVRPIVSVERLDVRNDKDKGAKLQVDMSVSTFIIIDKDSPVARRRAFPRVLNLAKLERGLKSKQEKPAAKSELASQKGAPAGAPAPTPGMMGQFGMRGFPGGMQPGQFPGFGSMQPGQQGGMPDMRQFRRRRRQQDGDQSGFGSQQAMPQMPDMQGNGQPGGPQSGPGDAPGTPPAGATPAPNGGAR